MPHKSEDLNHTPAEASNHVLCLFTSCARQRRENHELTISFRHNSNMHMFPYKLVSFPEPRYVSIPEQAAGFENRWN